MVDHRLEEMGSTAMPSASPVGAENAVTSCGLHILVYQAAESISSQRPDCSSGRRGSGACGRLLMQRPVRAMSVVVLDVLLQHDRQVAWSGDQQWSRHSRRSVPMKRSAIAFARGARTGVRMSAPANTRRRRR